MKFLVDANVLSEVTRPQPNASVVSWLENHAADMVVTPIVLGEIEYGIRLLPEGRKRSELVQWFAAGVQILRVAPLDSGTASVWSELLARLKTSGQSMPVKDSLIAASALQYGLTVVTRNTADFRPAGVPLVDPFSLSS
jgi:toxin FitB